jgi:hypothetical protein
LKIVAYVTADADNHQEWGLQFPVDKQEEMKERTKLKRFATVDVGLPPEFAVLSRHESVIVLTLGKTTTGCG